eukprot:TRINITY_DN3298_c0_g1_i1.p1 TRINITY_DN3298_c0_g1~~TRINITY_DN3298_c0_g1_i1.p1  ORF type:complete len:424 (-),score=100.44 TRINITY_DN3298_c0_g1_i1:19-1290(-)
MNVVDPSFRRINFLCKSFLGSKLALSYYLESHLRKMEDPLTLHHFLDYGFKSIPPEVVFNFVSQNVKLLIWNTVTSNYISSNSSVIQITNPNDHTKILIAQRMTERVVDGLVDGREYSIWIVENKESDSSTRHFGGVSSDVPGARCGWCSDPKLFYRRYCSMFGFKQEVEIFRFFLVCGRMVKDPIPFDLKATFIPSVWQLNSAFFPMSGIEEMKFAKFVEDLGPAILRKNFKVLVKLLMERLRVSHFLQNIDLIPVWIKSFKAFAPKLKEECLVEVYTPPTHELKQFMSTITILNIEAHISSTPSRSQMATYDSLNVVINIPIQDARLVVSLSFINFRCHTNRTCLFDISLQHFPPPYERTGAPFEDLSVLTNLLNEEYSLFWNKVNWYRMFFSLVDTISQITNIQISLPIYAMDQLLSDIK